ncbi:MAG: hypothetical protein LC620_04075, partial [Halobacteriales archaeon]|nr:hypothetical protein [Halobacteriales archaeon]
SWTALEARVAQLMEKVAPNVASVVGPVIGARLIALSGGLERLASWPAGTVQLLGAETALFRHLKEGTKPPKHGILFQHPSVHLAAPWSRGAVARALALATATAAKADAFTKNDLRAHLAEQVKADMERIAKRKMPARPQGGFGRGPPRGEFRGPTRGPPRSDTRGPPRGDFRGPPRGPWQGPPQRAGGAPSGDRPWQGPRDKPAWTPRGPPRDDRGPPDRGPPRDDRGGWRGPPRDDRGPSDDRGAWRGSGGTGSGKPYRRKPQGAFRSDNKPARPPGRGSDDRGGGA